MSGVAILSTLAFVAVATFGAVSLAFGQGGATSTAFDITSILTHGGTAGLLAFMFYQLKVEQKKNERLETERTGLYRETFENANKFVGAVEVLTKTVERAVSAVEKFNVAREVTHRANRRKGGDE